MSEITENIGKCPQLVIYLTLSLMSIIASLVATNNMYNDKDVKSKGVNLFNHFVMTLLMSALFYYLCAYDYGNAAWILLLFPVIIFFAIIILVFGIFSTTTGIKKDMKETEETEEERNRVQNEEFKSYQPKTTYSKF
jgi:cell division protein FtsW (lipid II flippase)